MRNWTAKRLIAAALALLAFMPAVVTLDHTNATSDFRDGNRPIRGADGP